MVVSITTVPDKNSWYHVSDKNNLTDIPSQISKINDFERCFDGPQFLYSSIDVSKFDVGEKLKLVGAVVQNEASVGKKVFQDAITVTTISTDFYNDAGHDFKEWIGISKNDTRLFLTLWVSMSTT